VRIVVDTNTLVSGTLWSGNPGRLLDAIKAGHAALVLTPQLWVEFVEVLNRPKFLHRLRQLGVTPTMLADSLRSHVAWTTEAAIALPLALRDPKDLLVLAAAVGAQADLIVSGDDDLVSMNSFEGIAILKARDALERMGLSVE
jgi:putative PIN family toxin of toxin-antitoxin system